MKRSRILIPMSLALCALFLTGAFPALAQDGGPTAPPADPLTADDASAPGSPAQIRRITVQENAGSAQPVFNLDDLRLVGK